MADESTGFRKMPQAIFLLQLRFLPVHRVIAYEKNTCGPIGAFHSEREHMKWRSTVFVLVCLCASLWTVAQENDDQTMPDVQTAGTRQKKHGAGKDDLGAIGNRKIGSKGFGNWYSLESEIALGKEYASMVESSVKLLNDPVISEYVNRIGQNLVRNSDAKVPFTIKVVDSEEINAFALPGGFMYVNSGLILVAQDEAQLAGVMAHEIAHVAARHATRQKTRSNLINLASIPLIFVGGGAGLAVREVVGVAAPLSLTKFSRSFEAEADYLGVQYLYKSGYDPHSFLSFFEQFEAHEKKKPGKFAMAFSTHPPTVDRIKKTQDEILRILPARELYVVSTSDFDSVKARLVFMANRRTKAEQEHRVPTLRRTAESPTGGDVDSPPDDERPTLNRRDH
jgi:predicted Zn-dependent protease